QALTLGCIAHHGGKPCEGGRLVGSDNAAEWYAKGEKRVCFRKLKRFTKNPALSDYYNSIVNLGLFVNPYELPDTDEDDESRVFTFDEIELSDIGLDLAERYNSGVGSLSVTRQLASKDRSCSVSGLAEFGRRGGLCELANGACTDRDLLRDIFFAAED